MSGKFIDAYSVLQVAPDADDAAVRARHRELAKQFHPDRGGRAADGELMMRINRARDVLLDPVARATFDEELAPAPGEGHFAWSCGAHADRGVHGANA
ncbi:curved-DNA-binding protein [Nocardioidaceae bacterium Broad-1]|nr:curved-DNA-binding protein [Nocardioidaceae bacterium Broad-1]